MTYAEVSKKRDEVIKTVWKKMVDLAEEYTYDKYQEITDIVSDWNSKHDEDNEIFMCDDVVENERIGLYLEDDHIIFKD